MPERKKKIVSMQEAVSEIKDGCFLAIGGFMIHNRPMELVREIIRRKVKDLTILPVAPGGSIETDLLIGAGCVKKILANYVGAEWLAPILPNYRKKIENGEIEVIDYDDTHIFCGLQAAARKLPCEVTKSGLGTDLLKVNPCLKVFKEPVTGTEMIAVPPIHPDVTIIHAQRSDPYGNIQHHGSVFMDNLLAAASEKVIVTVEEIISHETILRDPFRTTIPCHLVTLVTKVLFGSHPCSSHGYYNYDEEHLRLYVAAGKEKDTFNNYLDQYVYEPEGITGYLERVGGVEKIFQLRS